MAHDICACVVIVIVVGVGVVVVVAAVAAVAIVVRRVLSRACVRACAAQRCTMLHDAILYRVMQCYKDNLPPPVD